MLVFEANFIVQQERSLRSLMVKVICETRAVKEISVYIINFIVDVTIIVSNELSDYEVHMVVTGVTVHVSKL